MTATKRPRVSWAVLGRAVEGGAFDEILRWAYDDEADDLLWWTKIAEKSSEILGIEVDALAVRKTSTSNAFWVAIRRRRVI